MWGTRIDAAPPVLSFADAQFEGPNKIDNININIIKARHNDFSYSASDPRWTANPSADKRLEREINFKTSAFMQNLYRAAKDENNLQGGLTFFLLNTSGVAYDETAKTWTVDPTKLPYAIDYIY